MPPAPAPAPHPAPPSAPPSRPSAIGARARLAETTAPVATSPPAEPAWKARASHERRSRGLVCIPLGRGQTGKTLLGRYLLEQALRTGRLALPADGDRNNASLSAYRGLGRCMRPADADEESMRRWLGEAVAYASQHRAAVYADLGGGDRTAADHAGALIERVQPDLGGLDAWGLGEIGAILASVDVTLIYALGGGTDDPAGLRLVNRTALRDLPLILMLNEGVADRRGAGDPFAANLAHPQVQEALGRGSQVVRIPALPPSVARFLEENRLTFGEAVTGAVGGNGTALTLEQRQDLLLWMRAVHQVLKPHAGLLP